MARMISAVTVIFGTAERIRSMRGGIPEDGWGGKKRAGALAPAPWLASDLEAFDLVPQRAVLTLISWPDFRLRHLAEGVDVGFDHGHAERLQLGFGPGEIVDRLGRLANLLLGGARQIHHQLLVLGGEPVPDVEVHHRIGRAVI